MKINGSELPSLHLIRSHCKYTGSRGETFSTTTSALFQSSVLDEYLPGIIKINGLDQRGFTASSVAKERKSVLLHHLVHSWEGQPGRAGHQTCAGKLPAISFVGRWIGLRLNVRSGSFLQAK